MTKEYTGLKILGILSILGGLLSVLGGIIYVSLGGAVAEASQNGVLELITLFPAGIAIVGIGIGMIIMGALLVIIGYFLYKHKPWAYWLYFVLSIIGFVGSLFAISWLGILIGGIIIWYLWTIRKSFMTGADTRAVWRD